MGEKENPEDKYKAPKVCPRLLNIGKQITQRCELPCDSEKNRESTAESSNTTLLLELRPCSFLEEFKQCKPASLTMSYDGTLQRIRNCA